MVSIVPKNNRIPRELLFINIAEDTISRANDICDGGILKDPIAMNRRIELVRVN